MMDLKTYIEEHKYEAFIDILNFAINKSKEFYTIKRISDKNSDKVEAIEYIYNTIIDNSNSSHWKTLLDEISILILNDRKLASYLEEYHNFDIVLKIEEVIQSINFMEEYYQEDINKDSIEMYNKDELDDLMNKFKDDLILEEKLTQPEGQIK